MLVVLNIYTTASVFSLNGFPLGLHAHHRCYKTEGADLKEVRLACTKSTHPNIPKVPSLTPTISAPVAGIQMSRISMMNCWRAATFELVGNHNKVSIKTYSTTYNLRLYHSQSSLPLSFLTKIFFTPFLEFHRFGFQAYSLWGFIRTSTKGGNREEVPSTRHW